MTSQDLRDAAEYAATRLKLSPADAKTQAFVAEFLEKAVSDYDADRMSQGTIKFRAWDKRQKKMIYPSDPFPKPIEGDWDAPESVMLNRDGSLSGYIGDDGGKGGLWEHEVNIKDRYEIMQFTGLLLLDCLPEKAELYTDDIIEDERGRRYRIFAVEGGFVINLENKPNNLTDASLANPQARDFIRSQCKKIGNIHDSPELLDNEKGLE